jgi:hypothetical protein
MDSTIPQEIVQLNLPNIEQVVLAGGGAIEVQLGRAVRQAEDIDLIVSLANWRYLRDDLRWRRVIKDGRSCLRSPDNRFDVWRWWWLPEEGRYYFPALKSASEQHESGFLVLKLDELYWLKKRSGRQKYSQDITLFKKYL